MEETPTPTAPEPPSFKVAERRGEPETPALPPRRLLRLRLPRLTASGIASFLSASLLFGALFLGFRLLPSPAPPQQLPAQELAQPSPPVASVEVDPATITVDARAKKRRKARSKKRHVRVAFGAPSSSFATARPAPVAPEPATPKKKTRDKQSKPEVVIPQPAIVLYHLYNSKSFDHYYTTSADERDEKIREDAYELVGIEGKLFAKSNRYAQLPFNPDEGVLGYMFGKQQDKSLPLHYLRGPGGDLYTSDESQREWWYEDGWTYHGIVGYVGAA